MFASSILLFITPFNVLINNNGKLMMDTSSLWVTILRDKGSDETKICLITNVESANCCHHLLPLGIFKESERR
ncbi:hypothetical protein L5515_001120 [Caenorhabditis briggsae]|uniref:Uncharacterized protein n=1 Tax=Caenorhabditis briggsae TaxID=6238 RepID=A0AAE9E1X4_CAEBR|nr:hypothetical protein L5515_001120 [Caenorhabditis briggsae]